MLTLAQSARAMNGALYGPDTEYQSVSIDTRTITPGDLYVAIQGDRFDGHDFVSAAQTSGAVAAVLSRKVECCTLPIVLVEDTRLALGALAREWRCQLGIPVVGITGSNGKTTVKEMTAAILGRQFNVLYTRGNLNNDVGVPLTLLRLDHGIECAVIEMGANHAGEIAYTSGLALPDVSILTNAGAAHLEGFGSIDGVARAKAEIIEGLGAGGVAVLNADDDYFPLWKQIAGNRRVISFGFADSSDVRAVDLQTGWSDDGFETRFVLHFNGRQQPVRLRLAGEHNVRNALASASGALALDTNLSLVAEGLELVKPVAGRMQPTKGLNGACLIDDSYNANPSSFIASIDVLAGIEGDQIAVVGSFAELGEESPQMHAEVGKYAREKGISRLFVTGPFMREAVQAFGPGGAYIDSREALIEAVREIVHERSVVLVKGSRSQKMEQVVEALANKGGA